MVAEGRVAKATHEKEKNCSVQIVKCKYHKDGS